MRNTVLKNILDELFCVRPWQTKTHAHARVRVSLFSLWNAIANNGVYTRAFFDLKLTGLILTLILVNMNEKCLSVMKIWSRVDFHKMAPRLRHQSRSRLKTLLCSFHVAVHMCAKFQGIWSSHFQVIVLTKKSSYENIRWSVLYTAHLIIISTKITIIIIILLMPRLPSPHQYTYCSPRGPSNLITTPALANLPW